MLIDPRHYRNFSIKAPLATHFRPATCEEVECPQYLNGWKIRIDGLHPKLLHTALNSGRKYFRDSVSESENWLVFEAGQQCFQVARHRTRVDRTEIYSVRDGNGAPRKHTAPQFWVEELHEEHNKLAEAKRKG